MTEVARYNKPQAEKDEELGQYLDLMKLEDQALAMALEKERESVEHAIEKMHRLNNFRIDEAHIREANIAEANFLLQMQELERKWLQQRQVEEAASLKEEEEDRRMLEKLIRDMRALKLGVRQRREAGEKVKSVKLRIGERRQAFQMRLAAIESRQERERKALQDSHSRIVKNMSIYRQLLVREYEDQALESAVISMNDSQLVKGRALKAASRDTDKLHEAKMLQLKLRMQKEGEQLREEQLLRLKHMQKVCDLELDHVDEIENLVAEQKVQELELEVEQRREMEQEEERIMTQNDALKAFSIQRQLQLKAARITSQQRSEARQLARQHKIAAKQREKQFFENEEEIKQNQAELEEGDEKRSVGYSDGAGLEASRRSSASQSQGSAVGTEISDVTDADSMFSTTEATIMNAAGVGKEGLELQEQATRDKQRLDELATRHQEAMETLRTQQREYHASMKREHAEEMARLLAEQEDEYKQLKIQHHIEMDKLLKTQMLADQLEADNQLSNELLYGMLPRYVADTLKNGVEVEPKDFECITILYSDIVQFTNLTAKSRPQQIVNLLNRLYTAFDAILDDYTDVYKTETIGDAYQIVGGLNRHVDDGNFAKYAIEVVDCALRFIEEVEKLDMSDQAQEKLNIRIGVHSGPAVGGVAGITMPKFALFGDNVNIASLMEQKSFPNRVHISPATYELVKDAFEFEQRPDKVPIEGGEPMTTYWLVGRKTSPDGETKARAAGKSAAKKAAMKGVGSRMGRASTAAQ
ncbi:hypothetical protein HDV00_002922 [Rhizophlyctis rosea]|nr:hypothetical protein HDV00_002922 [Rhizophlyctis rosea]